MGHHPNLCSATLQREEDNETLCHRTCNVYSCKFLEIFVYIEVAVEMTI